MKTSTLLYLLGAGVLALIATAFISGILYERTVALQNNVTALADQVKELEAGNTRREERWAWARRIASHIPLIKGLIV